MRLALIYPPLADATQPYSSLPALLAYLRARTVHQVECIDGNLDFVRACLKPDVLSDAALEAAARLEELDARATLSEDEAAEYDSLARARLKAPFVVAGIEAAVADLTTLDAFRDPGRLNRSNRLIQDAVALLCACGLPFQRDPFARLGPSLTGRDLTAWATGPRGEALSGRLEPIARRIVKAEPAAIGISVTYRSQILPTVCLCILLRRLAPDASIILGGGIVSQWYDHIEESPEVFDWADFLIAFEGESGLAALCDALDGETSPDDVPNLVYRREGRIEKTRRAVEEIDSLPTPDYSGLPLHDYLAPEPVLLLSTSRGCYWGKCAFCTVSPSTRGPYRRRDPELVHRDLIELHRRYGATCISFGDDCVAPATLRTLSRRLIWDGPALSWQCEARFEPALDAELLAEMRQAGCAQLIFGLESFSPRVLDSMAKGTRTGIVRRILGDCRQVGIAFNLQLFFGFPGETIDEAQSTYEFVMEQAHGAASFSFGTFELQRGSPVARDPAAFGIHDASDGGASLGLRIEHTLPPHAAPMWDRLRRDLQAVNPFPHLGLAVDAHRLICLRECGAALACRMPRERACAPPEPVADALLREKCFAPSGQFAIGCFRHGEWRDAAPDGSDHDIVLFDYEREREAALSPLAAWVIQNLDGSKSAQELAASLTDEGGKEGAEAELSGEIAAIIGALYSRGFLVRSQP
jgi:hypothetical protein